MSRVLVLGSSSGARPLPRPLPMPLPGWPLLWLVLRPLPGLLPAWPEPLEAMLLWHCSQPAPLQFWQAIASLAICRSSIAASSISASLDSCCISLELLGHLLHGVGGLFAVALLQALLHLAHLIARAAGAASSADDCESSWSCFSCSSPALARSPFSRASSICFWRLSIAC